MADKKVISIRFHIDNKEDMELYNRLVLEAGTTASLAYVVKSRVRDSYNQQDEYKYSHCFSQWHRSTPTCVGVGENLKNV